MSISQEDLRSEISLLSDPVNEYRAGRRWMMSSARESGLALLALAPTSLLWGVQIRRGYYLNLFEQGTDIGARIDLGQFGQSLHLRFESGA